MKNDRRFKETRQQWAIIGVAVVVIFAVVLLTYRLHLENKAGVLSQFEDHQLAHAQHLAHQIQFFFQARSQELQALALLVSREGGVLKKRTTDMETYSKMMEHVRAVVIYNGSGEITYATDRSAAQLGGRGRELLSWAKRRENRGKVFGLPLGLPNSFMFLFAIPLYQDSLDSSPRESNGKFAGVLTLTVDLKDFLSNLFHFLGFNKHQHGVWILDRDGTLLFGSGHTEVVLKNIYQKDRSCQQCHASFDYVEKILEKKQGAVDYEMKNFPMKIASFAPMDFEETSWIVVLSSSYDEVAAYTKKSLREYLALLGIVVLASILGTASVIRADRLRVRAEEEVKHIQERRILEDKAQRSEALYRTIVENAHDAIWTVDAQGHLSFVNRRGEEISGYMVSELLGKDFQSLIPLEDLPRVKDLFVNILHGKVENFEGRFYAKDGKIRLLSVNAVPLYENGAVVGMFSIGRDITEQRDTEKALRESEKQLRHLSSQLLTAQETERRRISRELHDELGQALSVIKLQLSFVEKELKQDQVTVKEECEAISQYINQVIENVRRLSRDLTPSILEDAGLSAAIRWLISNSNKNYHHIDMAMDDVDIDHLFSQNAQIIVYRVLQEALTNIGKHARAKNVSIVIENHNGWVCFSVEDDGIGFDVQDVATVNPDERGLGLAIMEERARMLGGSLEIWSEKGKGTRISFLIPLEKGGSV